MTFALQQRWTEELEIADNVTDENYFNAPYKMANFLCRHLDTHLRAFGKGQRHIWWIAEVVSQVLWISTFTTGKDSECCFHMIYSNNRDAYPNTQWIPEYCWDLYESDILEKWDNFIKIIQLNNALRNMHISVNMWAVHLDSSLPSRFSLEQATCHAIYCDTQLPFPSISSTVFMPKIKSYCTHIGDKMREPLIISIEIPPWPGRLTELFGPSLMFFFLLAFLSFANELKMAGTLS